MFNRSNLNFYEVKMNKSNVKVITYEQEINPLANMTVVEQLKSEISYLQLKITADEESYRSDIDSLRESLSNAQLDISALETNIEVLAKIINQMFGAELVQLK